MIRRLTQTAAPARRFDRLPRVGMAAIACAVVALSLVSSAVAAASTAHRHQVALNSSVAQRLVLQQINAIRRRFGLPAGHATRAYQAIVAAAAQRNADPVAPIQFGVVEEYGVWGISTAYDPTIAEDVSMIVDGWVYHDGWEGSATTNLDCTSPTAPGCNGHRRAILSREPEADARLYLDAAVVSTSLYGRTALSIAVLLVWRA